MLSAAADLNLPLSLAQSCTPQPLATGERIGVHPAFCSPLTLATFLCENFTVQALATGQRICVDLAFSHLMLDQENKSMCKQLGYCWHANVRAAAPAHLVLTSVEVRGRTVQRAAECVGCMQALWVCAPLPHSPTWCWRAGRCEGSSVCIGMARLQQQRLRHRHPWSWKGTLYNRLPAARMAACCAAGPDGGVPDSPGQRPQKLEGNHHAQGALLCMNNQMQPDAAAATAAAAAASAAHAAALLAGCCHAEERAPNRH